MKFEYSFSYPHRDLYRWGVGISRHPRRTVPVAVHPRESQSQLKLKPQKKEELVVVDFEQTSANVARKIQAPFQRIFGSPHVYPWVLGWVFELQKYRGNTQPKTPPSNPYPIDLKCVLGSDFGFRQSQDHPPPTSNWGRVVLRTPEPFGKVQKIGIITGGGVREMKIIFEANIGNETREKT
ncbi:MAG: hypothetical protein IPL83_07385 [Bdellovibrionales bacterium]|nr:hypothetical protein [Bdellovibrionales bacterium]